LLKIPAEPGPELRIPGAAVQTRVVPKRNGHPSNCRLVTGRVKALACVMDRLAVLVD